MKYHVKVTAEAEGDIEQIYRFVTEAAPFTSAEWFNGLEEAVFSLERNPERCPLAPESAAFDEKIRQLLYGKRNIVYRILFRIRRNSVEVLHIRHGAMKHLEP